MNLYVWKDPYHVSYGGSFLAVLAGTEEAAREKAKATTLFKFGMRNDATLDFSRLSAKPEIIENFNGALAYHWEE